MLYFERMKKKIERRKLVLRVDAIRLLTASQIAAARGGMDTGGASALCQSDWDTCICW